MATATATQGNGNFLSHDPYDNWRNELTTYEQQRTQDKGFAEPYVKRTHKDYKARETVYNPITQKFNDQNIENQVQRIEKNNVVEVIASNKDRALRYEQTFDVINFDNKLKGLETNPDYPKDKPWYFRPGKDTNVEHNILSNIPLTDHHYNHPEKRPPPEEEKVQKIKKTTTTGLRDYNIVTGRYLEFHDAKLKTDQEIQRAEAAYKYWQTHQFDPVNCEYYDPNKEKEFVQTKEANMKEHGKDQVKKLPISVQNEGLMYNPINMKIEDSKRLYERDLREKNKRMRYEVRYDVETKTRKDGFSDQERADLMKLNKVSNSRFKIENDRGFDILTNDPLQGPQASKTIYQPRIPQPRGVWTKAMQTVNSDFLSAEERNRIIEEDEQKKKQSQSDFHKTQTDQLKKMQTYDPLASTNFNRRSQRVFKGTEEGFYGGAQTTKEFQAPTAYQGTEKNVNQMRKTIDNPRVGGSVARFSSSAQATPLAMSSHSQFERHSNQVSTKNQHAPPSSQSQVSSKREIRTGGFQKIGLTVTAKQ
eukprot:403336202